MLVSFSRAVYSFRGYHIEKRVTVVNGLNHKAWIIVLRFCQQKRNNKTKIANLVGKNKATLLMQLWFTHLKGSSLVLIIVSCYSPNILALLCKKFRWSSVKVANFIIDKV